MSNFRLLLMCGLLMLTSATTVTAQKTYHDYYKEEVEFYNNGDYSSFLEAAQKADSARPNHPTLLYNLAAAYVLNGQKGKAIEVLKKRSDFYAKNEFSRDKDFNPLRMDPGYEGLLENIKSLNRPRMNSKPAFSISKPNFHPEGIVFDAQTSRFLLGDIRSGRIFSYDPDGSHEKQVIDLSSMGYWSVMGMTFDRQSPEKLWVATSALPEFEQYDPALEGKSAVLLINITTAKIEKQFTSEGKHLFGDLVVASDGRIFVTDSNNPVIYVIDPGSQNLKRFAQDQHWWNLQGVAVSSDLRYLFVADYITGIFSINLTSRRVTPLMENNYQTRGADGIYLMDRTLAFIQNGTYPKRVGTLEINNHGRAKLESLLFTDQALDDLNEPTLGVIVDRNLFYIANSPWAKYDGNHNPISENWPEIHIWELDLK